MGEIDRGIDEILLYTENTGIPPAAFLRVGLLRNLPQSIQKKVLAQPRYQALIAETGFDDQFREELMASLNDIEHITGTHVAPDEDY